MAGDTRTACPALRQGYGSLLAMPRDECAKRDEEREWEITVLRGMFLLVASPMPCQWELVAGTNRSGHH